MSVKKTVTAQNKAFISDMAQYGERLKVPPEGWLRTTRKTLGLTLTQLAKRLGVTHSLIARNEHAELEGSITIKTMNAMANTMHCKFVYAIVPNESIDAILYAQAQKKATKIVQRISDHMALEDQELSTKALSEEIEKVTQELLEKKTSLLWDDDE